MTTLRGNMMALAAVTLMAGGCAYGSTTGNTTMDAAGMSNDRTVLRVTNNNWADMTIYLLRSGARQRLGTVPSQSTQTFVVPAYVMASSSEVYLMADPIGSVRTFTSTPIIINPGQSAEWKLENLLALSSVWIR